MTDYNLAKSPSRRPLIAAGALLLALAACGSDPAEPPAATASAAQAPGVQSAAAAQGAEGETVHLNVDCKTPSEGRMTFGVGQAVFAAQPELVREAVPVGLQPPLQREAVADAIRSQAAEGAGCPEKPLQLVMLAVAGAPSEHLVQGTIGLQATRPGAGAAQIVELTRDLQRNQAANCQRNEAGKLLICTGSENVGQTQVPVAYVVTTDTARTLNSGGPLAARCPLDQSGQPRGCEIIDTLQGGVTILASLSRFPQSTETLAAAHRDAVQYAGTLRR